MGQVERHQVLNEFGREALAQSIRLFKLPSEIKGSQELESALEGEEDAESKAEVESMAVLHFVGHDVDVVLGAKEELEVEFLGVGGEAKLEFLNVESCVIGQNTVRSGLEEHVGGAVQADQVRLGLEDAVFARQRQVALDVRTFDLNLVVA